MTLSKNRLTIVLILFTFFFITSCQNSTFSNVIKTAKYSLYGPDNFEITKQVVDNIPYACIAAKIGKGQNSVLVLGQASNQDLIWYSADNAILITSQGRLVKTIGFEHNLSNTAWAHNDPIASHLYGQPIPQTSQRIVDFAEDNNYGIKIDSDYEFMGVGKIKIVDTLHETYVIKEKSYAKQLDWHFENLFWKDLKTGFIWQSVQHFLPNTPSIKIQVLTPYEAP
ncbi:MAG: YjbF family lipoprotein [Alphaproteobacteria bacterium]